ncbi:hypothetical protein R5R35_006861 [Gryllus longicercus]|uniref:TATA element modulatory factor 1 TATA binding domain-containing protein n=1 Tax=Gryllus longicercus TaxID=2509291 RepID=A0AAN9VL74_9ORTH
MSWFDASGFANLAKSALKEAQKTIDKALDIKDEDPNSSNLSKGNTPTNTDAEADSFFASWGLKSSGGKDTPGSTKDSPMSPIPVTDSCKGSPKSNKLTMSSSLWGSFTGSFFDNPRTSSIEDAEVAQASQVSDDAEGDPVSQQPQKVTIFPSYQDSEAMPGDIVSKGSWEGEGHSSLDTEVTLCDDTSEAGAEHFSTSKLVVESEDNVGMQRRLSICETEEEKEDVIGSSAVTGETLGVQKSVLEVKQECSDETVIQVMRRRDVSNTNGFKYNRLSVISSESDKKSSESVEVLGSASSEGGSGCTTSPESDLPLLSPEMSASSSFTGLKLSALASSPESVEVIPDTPSSVEILCDESNGRTSETTMSSPHMSPGDPPAPPNSLAVLAQNVLDSNTNRRSTDEEITSSEGDKISPESVEVIPEEDEDEEEEDASVADDSYTSASESTATVTTTVMEQPSISFISRSEGSTDVTKSPLHVSKHHSGDASSNESSLYSSTISTKTDANDGKSPSTKILSQGLGAMESSYSDCLIISDVQINVQSEGPALTHSSSRSGLQLNLQSMDPSKSSDSVLEDETEKEAKNVTKTPPCSKQMVLLHSSMSVPGLSESSNEECSLLSDSRTVVNTDSSGEGTVMESSSEEIIPSVPLETNSSSGATIGRSAVGGSVSGGVIASGSESKLPLQHSSSYYVKTMLADAIGEDDVKDSRMDTLLPAREQSPISSESRSDMVKVESDQTSGHTSGDELETTTSSDIEIISSPNGDSSSTQSRQSPAKLLQRSVRGKLGLAIERSDSPGLEILGKLNYSEKVKGHQRELSETSSGGSEDCHYLEVEKLLKRMAEMTEILEARETKLVELSRSNVELQENNSELKNQLEAALLSKVTETQDIHQVTEEFTQRLSSLERKFQQAIRDKETYRKQLEQAKVEAASRMSVGELEGMVAEKDEIIRELREEGEKLSKQQLQHSNIIKKLRAKEKENENVIKNQKEQIEEFSQEVERLKRSLTAKDEVERTQIEAVHLLTAKTKRLEKERQSLDKQLEEMQHKTDTLKTSLEIANRDLAESRKASAAKDKEVKEAALSAELSAKQELLAAIEETQTTAQEEREQLLSQIEELHVKLRLTDEQHTERETSIRKECSELIRRLEQAEARNEELAQSVSVATRPLLRQLESLQGTNSTLQAAWEKQERHLSETISELQGRVSSLTEQERSSREQSISFRTRVSSLESRLNASKNEILQLKVDLERQQSASEKLKQDSSKEIAEAELLNATLKEQVISLQREMTGLEQQLAVERAAVEAEKRRTSVLQDQLRERESVEKERPLIRPSPPSGTPRSSPTLSFGRASLSESLSSTTWPQFQDDVFECSSSSGRFNNVYESLRSGNTTSLLEGLQAQLKLRDGEVQQLQWEMSRRDAERTALTGELSTLTARLEEQEQQLKQALEVHKIYEDIQHKYDALLQMYGEKVEETQELRLDLEDVKEMYKTQIDQLLKKEPTA